MTGVSDLPREDDLPYSVVANTTIPSKERYAKKHGYDFLSIRYFGTDHGNKLPIDGPVSFIRAYRAFRMLDEYDIVVWLDADSLITNPEIKIEDLAADNYSFYASWAWSGGNLFSTGNFILKRTETIDTLFQAFYENMDKFNDEQELFNTIYNQDFLSLRKTMKILDTCVFESLPDVDLYKSVTTPPWEWVIPHVYVQCPWKEGNFLVHITCSKNKIRMNLLQSYFHHYL